MKTKNLLQLKLRVLPVILSLTVFLFQSLSAYSQYSAGPLFPNTYTNVGDGTTWQNIWDVGSDDNNSSLVILSTSSISAYAQVGNFGFSIPMGATITGIKLTIERNASTTTVADYSVHLTDANGDFVGEDKKSASSWPTTATVLDYGGPDDLWNTAWTPEMINGSNFGAAISVSGTGWAYIDYMQITVYYCANAAKSVYASNGVVTVDGALGLPNSTSTWFYNTDSYLTLDLTDGDNDLESGTIVYLHWVNGNNNNSAIQISGSTDGNSYTNIGIPEVITASSEYWQGIEMDIPVRYLKFTRTNEVPCFIESVVWGCNTCITPTADEPAGDGSSEHPYEIASLENLYWITANSSVWDKDFIQTANIDASETAEWCTGGWLPIGDFYVNDNTRNRVFSGNYDGQGHTIAGLHIVDNSSYVAFGLFGTAKGATIMNLKLANANVNISTNISTGATGALVGYANTVSINKCSSSGDIAGGNIHTGGLVGDFIVSAMSNCYSTCNVNGSEIVGGLVAMNSRSKMSYCNHTDGLVQVTGTSTSSAVGGLVAINQGEPNNTIPGEATISRCFSTGTVTGFNNVGGLVASNYFGAVVTDSYSRCNVSSDPVNGPTCGGLVGNNSATISNCYSSGTSNKAPFVGNGDGGTITNSFWDRDVFGTDWPYSYGTPISTAEMKTQSTFTNVGWDFTTIWGISAANNDGYPYLLPESSCNNGTLVLSSDAGTDAQTVCEDSPISEITYTVGGGATGASISPALPTGLSGSYNADTKTFTISGTPTEATTYNYTITTSGTPSSCSEATASGTITVDELPDASFDTPASNSPICSGGVALFYLVGTPGSLVTYHIEGFQANGMLTLDGEGKTTINVHDVTSDISVQLISVKDLSGRCLVDLDASSTVVVNPLPTATLSGTATVCKGESTDLNVVLTGTQPWNVTYTDGTTPVKESGITTSPYTINVSPTATATYSLTAVSDVNCNGTSFTGSATITVKPAPTLSSISVSNTLSCYNDDPTPEITFSGLRPGENNIYYTLIGFSGDSPISYPLNVLADESGEYTMSLDLGVGVFELIINEIEFNGCDTVFIEDEENNIGLPAVRWTVKSCCTEPTNGGEIAGNQTICSGSDPAAFTSSSGASGETGTLEYKWQYSESDSPYNWNDISSSNSETFDDATTLTADRWYQRLARVECSTDWTGAVSSNILKVTVDEADAGIMVSGPTTFCEGGSVTLTASDASSWIWSNGAITQEIIVKETGDYYVTITNENGCIASTSESPVSVTVNSMPTLSGVSVDNESSCYDPDADPVITFSGLLPGENVIFYALNENHIDEPLELEADKNGDATYSFHLGVGTFVLSIDEIMVNGCTIEPTENNSVTWTVYAIPGAPIAEDQSFCSGDNPTVHNLVAFGEEGATFNWYDLSGEGFPLSETDALSNGTYYVSQTVNGCESARTPADVTVFTTPAAPTAEAQSFCIADDPIVAGLKASGEEGAIFNWYYSAEGGTPIFGKVQVISGIYYVSQTVNGCESPRTEVHITVNDMPEAGELEGKQLICEGTYATWSVFEGETDGIWSSDNTSVATVSTKGQVSGIKAGTANISYTVEGKGGCKGTFDVATMTISVVKPPNAGNITGPETLCIEEIAQLTSDGDQNGSWTSLDDDVLYIDNTGLVTAVGAGTAAISYSVEGAGGCKSDEAIWKITVFTNSVAPALATSDPATSETADHVCPGDLVSLTVSGGELGTNPDAAWTWYKGSCGSGEPVGTGESIEVQPTETTTYFARAEGGCNTTACASVDVWVWPQTEITKQPGDALIKYGCLTKFDVAASGRNLSYQWYQNDTPSNSGGEPIADATSTEFWPDCSEAGTFYYYVNVTGTCGTAVSNVSTLTIDPQAASASGILYYTGPKFAFTQNENSGTATIMLSATIKNNEAQVCSEFGGLAEAGDIRTALISFEIDKGNGWEKIPGATNLPVNYVDPNDISLGGSAAAMAQIDIGEESGVSCNLRVVVSGNYTGEPSKMENPITIVKPQAGGIIMGTVGLCNENSVGFVKGMTGEEYNTVLNFEVKYSDAEKIRGADKPKGKVWLLVSSYNNSEGFPDGEEHTYLISSNAIADLAIENCTAHFTAKANVVELLDGGLVNSLEGNCTMVLDLVKDETCDKVGITVYRAKAKGGIWYSNNWISNKTVPVCICDDDYEIGGCNLQEAAVYKKTKSIVVQSEVEQTQLKVYPNPFSDRLKFEFTSPVDTQVRILIFDITGRLVSTVFDATIEQGVRYHSEFVPTNEISGIYLYRVIMGDSVSTGKVTFRKR